MKKQRTKTNNKPGWAVRFDRLFPSLGTEEQEFMNIYSPIFISCHEDVKAFIQEEIEEAKKEAIESAMIVVDAKIAEIRAAKYPSVLALEAVKLDLAALLTNSK